MRNACWKRDTFTSLGSRPAPTFSSDAKAQSNATTAGSLVTKPSPATDPRDAANVRKRDTATHSDRRSSRSAFSAAGHTNRSVATAEYDNYTTAMCTNLQILQLNVGKRDAVQLSMMNDGDLRDYAVLAVAEPYALNMDGKVVTAPNNHRNWTRLIPTKKHEMRWPIRSMLWIRRDLEAEQVPIPSADLTGAIIRLPDRNILGLSVYVEGRNENALRTETEQLHRVMTGFRNSTGKRTDVILAGTSTATTNYGEVTR